MENRTKKMLMRKTRRDMNRRDPIEGGPRWSKSVSKYKKQYFSALMKEREQNMEWDDNEPLIGSCAECTEGILESDKYHVGQNMVNENFGGRPIMRSYIVCDNCYIELDLADEPEFKF